MSELTITEFLTARLNEDDAWAAEHPHFSDSSAPDYVPPWWTRVERETKAKRAIVESETERQRTQWRQRVDEHRLTFDEWQAQWPSGILRNLASVYADHPDYREEWKP